MALQFDAEQVDYKSLDTGDGDALTVEFTRPSTSADDFAVTLIDLLRSSIHAGEAGQVCYGDVTLRVGRSEYLANPAQKLTMTTGIREVRLCRDQETITVDQKAARRQKDKEVIISFSLGRKEFGKLQMNLRKLLDGTGLLVEGTLGGQE